jgi:iron complex outermembrane receptor protein
MRKAAATLCGLGFLCGGPALAPALAAPPVSEVVVTASPLAGSKDRFATIVETVGRDKILQAGGGNLADALGDIPGVSSTSFASGASRPVIRGMDANRVKVLEDGLGSSDVSEIGPDHGVPIDPLSARAIEVVRGAATLRYGSQAIGGVVNAINDRVPTKLPDKWSGEMTGSFASSARVGQGSLLADGAIGQFAVHADGFVRTSRDYSTPDGTQDNSFLRASGESAGGSYFFGDSRVGAAVVNYDARYGIPSDTTFIDMRQTKVLSNSSFAIDAGPLKKLNVDAGYADYQHREIDPAGDIVLSTFTNREWDGRGELIFDKTGPLSASAIGVQVQDRRFSAGGEGGNFLSPTQTQSGALFAFAEAPLGSHFNLQGAARAETVQVKGTPLSGVAVSKDYTPVSGSLGVLFTVNDALKIGFTATSAARPPGQVELFARGPHDGPATFEIGDPTLKIERANSAEATLRVNASKLTFEGSVWGARFDNYIYGALTGNLCNEDGDCTNPPDGDLKQLLYTQRDARFWGAEAKAGLDIINAKDGVLTIKALADLVRANLTDGGGPVPRIQPWRAGGGLAWSSAAFDAGVNALYVGKRDKVAMGETPTDGYWNYDAQIAYRPGSDNKLEFAVVGHNLSNELQRNAVSFNKDDVLLPGRDVRIVLRKTF